MRIQLPLFLIIVTMIVSSCGSKQENIESLIKNRLNRSIEHYTLMAESLIDQPKMVPQSIDKNGKLLTTTTDSWISGFVPGTLWYLYEYNKSPALFEYAKNYTARLEKEQSNKSTHDLGFMLYCSFGNGYRLTKDPVYRRILLTGSESLSSRFNPVVGCIQSWKANSKWQYPVIIDNMMNLEFLFWASKTSNNPKYKNLSINHADKTIEHHFRQDYSSYHVVSYDTITGYVEKKTTHQGFSDESAWSRGQAWALYGYVIMYRETKNSKYLEIANHIARFLLDHPNMPNDKIPYWDFNAPDIPYALRDASAGAIIASSLIELSQYVNKTLSKEYLDIAEIQIRTLSSPEYFAEARTNGNFILKHSVGFMGGGMEIDVPLSYADYYYVEALMRYQKYLDKKQ